MKTLFFVNTTINNIYGPTFTNCFASLIDARNYIGNMSPSQLGVFKIDIYKFVGLNPGLDGDWHLIETIKTI